MKRTLLTILVCAPLTLKAQQTPKQTLEQLLQKNALSAQITQPRLPRVLPPKAYLGISLIKVRASLSKQYGIPYGTGMRILDIRPGKDPHTPALQKGDIIYQLDDQYIVNLEQYITLCHRYSPGDQANISFIRGTEKKSAQVTFSQRPQPSKQAQWLSSDENAQKILAQWYSTQTSNKPKNTGTDFLFTAKNHVYVLNLLDGKFTVRINNTSGETQYNGSVDQAPEPHRQHILSIIKTIPKNVLKRNSNN